MNQIPGRRLLIPIGTLVLTVIVSDLWAQAEPAATPASTAAESTDTVPHKKHGLWGKAKSIAGNKVVKSVAKAAACTMVPGGQVIAGAIDAAEAKSVGQAAEGAAPAATGAACMPGMGMTSAAANAAAASAMSGTPQAMMPYGAGAVGGYAGVAGAVQQLTAQAQTRMAGAPVQTAAGTMTEAPGQLPVLAPDPAAELAMGKTAIRQIDWVAGSSEVSAAAQSAFEEAIAKLGLVMRQAGGRYRLDLYLTQRYDEGAAKMYGPGRLAAVRQLLGAEVAVESGKVKRDKDPRLEIVRRK